MTSVICCTETWLSPNQNFKIFKIKENQPLIESSCKRRGGGGICLYIKCGINYEINKRTSCNNIQLLSVKITNEKLKNTIITCVFISPSAVKTQTLLILQKVFDDIIVAPSTHHLLCGDFNINVLRKSKQLSELISILNGNDLFLQKGNKVTRETKTSKTCIDLFFFQCKKPVTIFKTSVTDHYGVILNATAQTCKNKPFITKPDHGTNLNWNLF